MSTLPVPSSNPPTEGGSPKPMGNSLSISSGGKCRLRSWLDCHGYPSEPSTPQQERVFEYGDALEWLLFDRLQIPSAHDPGGIKIIGDWWNRTELLRDPATGQSFNPSKSPFRDRQRRVYVGKYAGHIDALAEPLFDDTNTVMGRLTNGWDGAAETFNKRLVVVDSKSANGYSYDRACHENLSEAIFSREYVISQNLYVEGLRREGLPVEGSILVYLNKEHGPMMYRFIPYDPAMVAEGIERLTTAEKTAEPSPDWPWAKGENIPLRCSYCEYKTSCAGVRGVRLGFSINRKGKPEWTVA